jgi:DNA-binding CsgD family transcriptional regulator/tetratricopeptide (TPR) repeat protein
VGLCPVVVGRDDELRLLEDALAGSGGGQGALVFVTGEPGIGKSRLVRELAGHAVRCGAVAVTGRAVPAESGTPYRPLTEALLQILRDRPLPGDTGLAPWLPALRAVLPGIAGEEDGDASSVARGEAVIRLIRRLGLPGGLLVILEDLHWADPDTLAVVEYLADNLAGERVLCVATSRSEPPSAAFELVRRLEGRRGAEHVSLGRLGDDEVARMVRACAVDWDDELVARVQRAADGVPFLVEEVLASPGVPESFTGMVRSRLASFADDERLVLEAAAVFGRHFDWQLLGPATGLAPGLVSGALERAVGSQLLTVDGAVFRFRHALTREAVAAGLLPPRRRSLAASALAAVDVAHPELDGAWREVAADLAAQAGDIERAGTLLAALGEAALDRGALATAADTLRRAAAVLADPVARASAEGLLVGCLALAGRADEAMAVGERLIASWPDPGAAGPAPADIHIGLARAAIAATRWPAASAHVEAAQRVLAADPRQERGAHIAVLGAELALARDDIAQAGKLAHAALDSAGASPEVRCQALEVIGRIARLRDLDTARGAFERALAIADTGHLPFWRLRALHELGTIELFEFCGTERLSHARRAAAEAGAFSTVAVLDLQLAAAYDWRFEFGESTRHARLALAGAQRLGISEVQAKALLFLAEAHAMRQDHAEMERCLRQATLAAPDDRSVEAFGWGGCRAMSALFGGDLASAMPAFGRSMSILRTLPHAEPAMFRALWPLVLAATGDNRASAALAETRRTTVTVSRFNRGALGYADAILAGRRGDRDRAAELASIADSDIGAGTFGHLARLLAAESARSDGWGEPARWLESAHADFTAKSFGALAAQCQTLLQAPAPDRLARLGVTPREADVLLLVAEGLPNKEIAARLHLSPRTVEKHVESLLRKTGARSRTKLVAIAGPVSAPPAGPGT